MDASRKCECIHTSEEEFSESLAGGDGDTGNSSLNSLAQTKRQRLFDAREKMRQIFKDRQKARFAEIVPLLESGLNINQCAERMGITRATVGRLMAAYKLRKPSYVPAPEMAEKTRLITEALKSGMTAAKCRDKFKVSLGVVAGIYKRGKDKNTLERRFSPERDQILRENYATATLQHVVDVCNAVAGSQISISQVIARASFLKLKRPPVPKKERRIVFLKSIKSNPPLRRGIHPRYTREEKFAREDPPSDDWAPGGARIPVSRSWEEIKELAAREGYFLSIRYDLVGYNKSRIRRGCAPYAISNLQQKWR